MAALLSFGNVTQWVSESVRRAIPSGCVQYLLPFGLMGIAAAQLIFNVGQPQHLPVFGVFAILVGISAVALWAGLVGQTAIPRGGVVGTPAPLSVFGSVRLAGNRMKSLSLGLGVVLSAILLFRVISGHDNTWDVGLWLASITLLGALFAPEFRWRATGHEPSNLIARGWATARRNWRAVIPLLVLLVVFCAVVAPNLTAWRYAALGDEYLFYEHAKSVIESGTTIPFSQNGVYDHHPVLNTIYKAVWMHLFGSDHFGWKMTGVVSMALSISGVYVLAGLLWE